MSTRSEEKTMAFAPVLRFVRSSVLALGLGAAALGGGAGQAVAQSHETAHPEMQKWSFWGPFGKFDTAQLQRGFKIYREVCSSCHALSMVSFRNLMEPGGPGFTEGQVRAVAAEYQIMDGPNDAGEMAERPGRLSDTFPKPFPNEQAARAANGGAYPPDMSLLAKARTYERGFPWFLWDIVAQYQEQGPDYIHALIGGYEEPPEGVKPTREGLNYNKYMPGHWIAMAQPIQDDQVEYSDGTPTTVDQHLTERKSTGLVVIIFLAIFATLLYFTKKKVWAGLKEQSA